MNSDQRLFVCPLSNSTPAASNACLRNNLLSVIDHFKVEYGEWGEASAESNLQALNEGGETRSLFTLPDGAKILVITQPGKSGLRLAEILLPEEEPELRRKQERMAKMMSRRRSR